MDYEITIAVGGTPLADGTDAVGRVLSLSINGTALIQEAQPIRAASPSFFDRFGKKNRIEFTIGTEHDTAAEALGFIAGRRGAVPGVASLAISLSGSGMAVAIAATEAKWDSVQCPMPVGIYNRVSYTVETGLLGITTTETGGGTVVTGPVTFFVPTEPLALIDPLVIPSGQTAEIPAGRVCFAYSTSISGTLTVDPAGLLQLVPEP